MSEAVAEPQDEIAPLDFTGAHLVAPRIALLDDAESPDEPAPDEAPAAPEDLLVSHSFGDAAVLLPSATAGRRMVLETIRARHRVAGRPKRRKLLVCTGGAALPPDYAADAEVEAVPDEAGAVRAAIGPETAGLFIAPVRLAAGLETVSGAFLAELREAADEYGLALIFDETDAGLGRTGMAFAHEWTGVAPDLMLVGEGAGLPLACLVLTDKYARALARERPEVAPDARARASEILAAALAPGFEGRIQNSGWLLEDRLAALRYGRPQLFSGMVGTGLVQGLVCADPDVDAAAALARRLAQAGLLARACGPVLAFLPPLGVEDAQIGAAMDLLDKVVAEQTVATPA